ncbi:MAG: hypothetical protein H6851_07520 [Geminicoccaceae bacterium]|nr:hypothetical protein [Geminicoccaceae bacterium]
MTATRRILLATAAATPLATPAIAAPVDPVIPLCEEYFRRAKWLQSGNHGLDDEQFEAECDAWMRVFDQLAAIRPTTIEGVIMQLRAFHREHRDDWHFPTAPVAIRNAIEALEALA